MLTEHFDAARARLVDRPELANKVDEIARTDKNGDVRANYVILSVSLPKSSPDRLTGEASYSGDQPLGVAVRVVATSPGGLRDLVDVVCGQMEGHRLDVIDRAVSALSRDVMFEPDWNKAANLYFQDIEFSATTSRV